MNIGIISSQDKNNSQIGDFSPAYSYNNSVNNFEKLEIDIDYDFTGVTNPFDFEELNVFARISTPSGVKDVDAFYYQNMIPQDIETTHNLTPTGSPKFKVRFTPKETGNYTFRLFKKVGDVLAQSSSSSFTVSASSNKGFIQKDADSLYFKYNDNSTAVLVGKNLAYSTGYLFPDYLKWIDEMKDSNQNYARVWAAGVFGFGIEWKNGHVNSFRTYEGLKKYEQKTCWALDWLVDEFELFDAHIQPTLLIHNEVMSLQPSNFWDTNPYNVVNGGMCTEPNEFFSNSLAKSIFKNRLRYLVARYGYSPTIIAWELGNELNNIDEYSTNPAVKPILKTWLDDMSAYLKSIDEHHMVTVSLGDDNPIWHDPNVWNSDAMDYTTFHLYNESTSSEDRLANIIESHIEDYDKPVNQGETGPYIQEPNGFENVDVNGIQLHNVIWAGSFNGAFSTPLYWQWDNYISVRNLNYHYNNLKNALSKVNLSADNFRPNTDDVAYVGSGFSEFILSPTANWGDSSTPSVTIDNAGNYTGVVHKFQYGLTTNAHLRQPVEFTVNYPNAGKFGVDVELVEGLGGNVTISINGSLVYNQLAVEGYMEVDVPAGNNIIKFENQGDGWILINNLFFKDIIPEIKTFSLRSEDDTKAISYVLNRRYNYINVIANGQPNAIQAGNLVYGNMSAGSYTYTFRATSNDALLSTNTIASSGTTVTIPLPSFVWDAYVTLIKN